MIGKIGRLVAATVIVLGIAYLCNYNPPNPNVQPQNVKEQAVYGDAAIRYNRNKRLVARYQNLVGISVDSVVGATTCRFLKRNMEGKAPSYNEYVREQIERCMDYDPIDDKRYDECMEPVYETKRQILDMSKEILDLPANEVKNSFCNNQGTVRQRCLEDCFQYK